MNIFMRAHIAGGSLAIRSGAVALAARKRGSVHVRAGTWFLVSMLVLGVTATILVRLKQVLRVAGERLEPSPPARRNHCIGPLAGASHKTQGLEQLAWIESRS